MKKIFSAFFILTMFLTLAVSCKDKDPLDKGNLVSATYHSTLQKFTLTYSNGYTESVNAVIDNSTVPPSASYRLDDGTNVYVKNATVSGKATIGEKPDANVNVVSLFVYDGMSLFYLWNDEITSKIPTVNDTDPEEYFYGILNEIDTKHQWSWITDDVDELMSGFQGEATDAFGFQPFPLYFSEESNQVVGLVRFVYPDTPADKAGIKRGDVITHANGALITDRNYLVLYGANSLTTFTVTDSDFKVSREVSIEPASISTDPVLYHSVYKKEGKNIGYLFYTGFTENFNASLHRAFTDFKDADVTDLVLDLRYNPGGNISAAIYLASLIAPVDAVKNKEAFTAMSYNDFINSVYDANNWGRKSYLGSFSNGKHLDPLTANINKGDLNLYVITTGSSASASELVTFCLKPFMTVNQIGEKTSGKYTASWTIHAYNNYGGIVQPVYEESSFTSSEKSNLKNWAMQPIVGRYTDKDNNDFIDTNGLIPNHPVASTHNNERNTRNWKPIGDESDYLFAKAISLITGKPYATAQARDADITPFKDAELYSPMENVFRRGVIVDGPGLITPMKKSN